MITCLLLAFCFCLEIFIIFLLDLVKTRLVYLSKSLKVIAEFLAIFQLCFKEAMNQLIKEVLELGDTNRHLTEFISSISAALVTYLLFCWFMFLTRLRIIDSFTYRVTNSGLFMQSGLYSCSPQKLIWTS